MQFLFCNLQMCPSQVYDLISTRIEMLDKAQSMNSTNSSGDLCNINNVVSESLTWFDSWKLRQPIEREAFRYNDHLE